MPKFVDYTGKQVAHYYVIGLKAGNGYAGHFWMVRCTCGNESCINADVLRAAERTPKTGCRKCYCRTNARPVKDKAVNRILGSYLSAARARKLSWELSFGEFQANIESACTYCGTIAKKQPRGFNGVDRLNNKQGYTQENSVACCRTCNIAKQGMSVEQFLTWARRVVNFSAG